jgi:hypothetical protein
VDGLVGITGSVAMVGAFLATIAGLARPQPPAAEGWPTGSAST